MIFLKTNWSWKKFHCNVLFIQFRKFIQSSKTCLLYRGQAYLECIFRCQKRTLLFQTVRMTIFFYSNVLRQNVMHVRTLQINLELKRSTWSWAWEVKALTLAVIWWALLGEAFGAPSKNLTLMVCGNIRGLQRCNFAPSSFSSLVLFRRLARYCRHINQKYCFPEEKKSFLLKTGRECALKWETSRFTRSFAVLFLALIYNSSNKINKTFPKTYTIDYADWYIFNEIIPTLPCNLDHAQCFSIIL